MATHLSITYNLVEAFSLSKFLLPNNSNVTNRQKMNQEHRCGKATAEIQGRSPMLQNKE